jgi:hypothetical protein
MGAVPHSPLIKGGGADGGAGVVWRGRKAKERGSGRSRCYALR